MSDAPFALGSLPRHGGALAEAETRFGRPAEGWMDLSTGINPFAYPLPPLAAAVWQRLPDADAVAAVQVAAAAAWSVPDPDWIVAAAGSQAVLQMLPLLRPPSTVAVVGPTYSEYAECWSQAGHRVIPCPAPEEVGDAEVVVVCNPNNPDGRRFDPARLRGLARSLEPRGGVLIVDEAFGELAPELALTASAGPGLVVLRSLGKFFGLAGLRLGFAVCDPAAAALLRRSLGPWPVNGVALAVGAVALADTAWIAEMRAKLEREAAVLDALLGDFGLAVAGGTSLFRLVGAPRAWALYEHLAARGILVRPFAQQPRWLRFGLPADDAARARLADALAAWNA